MDNPLPSVELDFRRELRLLCRWLSPSGDSGASAMTAGAEEGGAIDWSLLMEWAKHHRVMACLHSEGNGREWERCPEFVRQVLKREHKRNVIRMLRLSGEIARLCRQFAERQIRVLQLKGPGLALDLFGDLSLRSSKDLDMLVAPEDLEAAEQLLRELGYTVEGTVYTVLNGWKWRNYHRPFLNPENGINVEMHWRLGPGPSREPGFEALWERSRTGVVAGCAVHCLGREDLFYYLAAHGARHGWFRLQWLRDIDRLARQPLNWNMIGLHLSRYQARSIGGQALLLSHWLFGTPLNEQMRKMARPKRVRRLAAEALRYIREKIDLHADLSPGMVREYKRYRFRIKSRRQKALYLLSTLYPHPLDASTLPLPNPVHFLYFPLKPLLWIWRKTRKNAWTA